MNVKYKVTIERITNPKTAIQEDQVCDEAFDPSDPDAVPRTMSPPANVEFSDYIYIQVVDLLNVASVISAVNSVPHIKEPAHMAGGVVRSSKGGMACG